MHNLFITFQGSKETYTIRWTIDTINGQTGSTIAADRRPTNCGQLNGEVANILATSYEDAMKMSQEVTWKLLL